MSVFPIPAITFPYPLLSIFVIIIFSQLETWFTPIFWLMHAPSSCTIAVKKETFCKVSLHFSFSEIYWFDFLTLTLLLCYKIRKGEIKSDNINWIITSLTHDNIKAVITLSSFCLRKYYFRTFVDLKGFKWIKMALSNLFHFLENLCFQILCWS